jgi:hypothetical protein
VNVFYIVCLFLLIEVENFRELTQITPVYNIASQSNNTTPPPKTKAIPIVAPPSVPSPPASSQATASKDNSEEAQALVASFEGKPIHEKKQMLGDKLFPLVKVRMYFHFKFSVIDIIFYTFRLQVQSKHLK